MEWVETIGRTVEEAKDAALDQLGVDEQDAEFEVVEEPRTGLFGRTRGEARVRARIQPAQPRAKVERRDRRRRGKDGESSPTDGSTGGRPPRNSSARNASGTGGNRSKNGAGAGKSDAKAESTSSSTNRTTKTEKASSSAQPRRAPKKTQNKPESNPGEGNMSSEDVGVDEQADLMTTFVGGLLTAFGAQGTIERVKIDDDTIELKVVGEDLGLLIGPKGQTLQAVQELSRTYVQRKATGTHYGRVRIDIGGYRERRREALGRFTEQVAAQVLESGAQKALEPMNASDRKVVHDTANDIEGVSTSSEGDEPRRRVVISPS